VQYQGTTVPVELPPSANVGELMAAAQDALYLSRRPLLRYSGGVLSDTEVALADVGLSNEAHVEVGRPVLTQEEERALGEELYTAAEKGDQKAAKAVLCQGVDPSFVHIPTDYTPLHIAAASGEVDMARLLIEWGADMTYSSRQYGTPLHVAVGFSHDIEMVRLLLDAGADVAAEAGGATPLHSAAAQGLLEIASLLCERGAPLEAKEYDGSTPLHLAAAHALWDVVEHLCSVGACPDARDQEGRTPMDWAVEDGEYEPKERVQKTIAVLTKYAAK